SVILGRNVMLLMPKNQDDPSTDVLTRIDATSGANTTVSAYQNNPAANIAAIDCNAAAVATNGETAADITESRTDVAATTTAQLKAYLIQGLANAGGRTASARFEADHYCYRHAALRSVYDTEIQRSGSTSLPNGYFRMSPIALQGVSSFAVDWTDGSVFTGAGGEVDVTTGRAVATGTALIGTTKWFGIYNDATGMSSRNASSPYQSTMVDYGDSPAPAPVVTTAATSNGDSYTAIFSYDNPTSWPVALRFRYHVADPSGRLPGGRDVVTIVKLP
ncbi:MAG TPA: hypothetical protein VG672_28710, partial [Bryobacteraceae bacterium]|nr:hypothetical protein [Bryobacteraceae bacterium]